MNELTRDETNALIGYEAVIEHGLETFVEVGNALSLIRDGRLYRGEFDSFTAYLRGRWQFTRQWAYDLMGSAQSAVELSSKVDISGASKPDVDAVAKLKPEELQAAIVATGKDKPKVAEVRKAVIDKNETIRPQQPTTFEQDADEMTDEEDYLSELDKLTSKWRRRNGKQFVIDGLYIHAKQLKAIK